MADCEITCEVCGVEADWPDVTGIEVRGVYDGVLIWKAPCGHMWPRFHASDPLHHRAVELINDWSAAQEGSEQP